jgi:tetratricopeptide (TPR) repeat protein
MEDRLIAYVRLRERRQRYKELAARSCYSGVMVMIALVVLRPLIVDQILSRADAYSIVGKLDECQRQCDKALLIDEDSSRAWCLLARIAKLRGNREIAYGNYEKAVQADNTNISAHFELGVMYMDDGRHELAIPHFEQVRRLGPEKPANGRPGRNSYHRASLYMLVLCYEKIGDPIKTELTLKQIRVFYPDCENPEKLLMPLRASDLARSSLH